MTRTRRTVLMGIAAMPLLSLTDIVRAAQSPRISVYRDPNCGCCGRWVEHLRAAGFTVDVSDSSEMNRVKARLGVSSELASCHTAKVGRYVIEGYVPASAVRRLMKEAPEATGLAVPGMPIGSPGMEVSGTAPEIYDVYLFGPSLRRTYARFRGASEVSR